MYFAKFKKNAFFLIAIRYISQKCIIFAPHLKTMQKYNKNFKYTNIMKKLFQIVFYYDQLSSRKACESKILFDCELTAQQVAHKICKEKKFYFKLKEFWY